MSLQKHRSKGRGGSGRGQKSYRPGSSASPPPPTLNFAHSDNGHTTDIFANKFMVYYVISNLGETARVQVQNGDIYEGVLKAVSSKFDCSLGEAHLVQQKKSNGLVIEDERMLPSRDGLISTIVIALKDIVSVNITKTEEPEIVISVDSFTDAAIANVAQKQTNGQINERKLERWVPDGPDIGGGLEDNVKVNGWSADEMFKTNEEKFGVKSTYNEDLLEYTTPLPKDSTGEMELKAEQAAREIEQSRGHLHRQEVDSGKTEEEMYAAVVRPQTTSADPRTPQVSPGQSSVEGKPQREAAPETTQSSDERKATDTDTPAVQLLASNSQGKSKWSETVMFDTCPERPGQPSRPVLEGKLRSSGFTVAWVPPEDMGGSEISAYVLQADDGKGGQFTEVYRDLGYDYTFTGLSPGHLFKIRLAAVSDGGTSEWSKATEIRTLPVVPGQANPPVLSKSNKPQPNTLDLRWDPPSYDGGAAILNYIMEMETPGTKEFIEIHHLCDNMCTVAGLHRGRTYSFRVKAKNKAGVGKVSAVSHITTAPGSPDTPRAPETLCRSAAAIIVSWESPAENGTPVTGYTVEWMEDGAFTELYSGPGKTCEVRKGVSPASFYYFRVKALSAVGPSLWSPVSTCQTPAASPSAVTSIRVVQNSSSLVSLRWRHPGNNGAPITSYNVEVAGFKNISFNVNNSEGSEAEEETTSVYQDYDINELQPNTVYRIRVQAVNKIGCGPFSATLCASTGDLPPPAPLLELATPSFQSLKLRWTSRGTNGKTGTAGVTYKLEMLDKNGSFVTVFNGPTTSHKVGKLLERTEYQFRIQASNDAGPGSFSDVVSFVTTAQPPNIVKGLKVENVTPSSLIVSWEAVQTVKKGEPIEYLLQSQCVGKDPDFVQVYQGPNTKFEYNSPPGSAEVRFRVCALRLMNAPNQSPGFIKGVFSAVSSARIMTPKKRKILESSAESDDRKPEIKEATRVVLTDMQWAMIFFSGFSLLAIIVILLLPSLLEYQIS